MARLFDDASSEYLTINSTVLTATPITMACWFNSDSITAGQMLICITDTATGDHFFYMKAGGDVASDPVRIIARDTGNGVADTSTGYSANTWHHACGVFASTTSRSAYLDGGGKISNTTSITPSAAALDATTIGVLRTNALAEYMSGRIAEVAIWNIALTDGEVAILALGYSPLFIHPQSLVAYWPLIRESVGDGTGDGLDIVGGNN
ncbi:hypothetical protein LCGC14_2775960, partial [marine sediment metagenome]